MAMGKVLQLDGQRLERLFLPSLHPIGAHLLHEDRHSSDADDSGGDDRPGRGAAEGGTGTAAGDEA